MNRGGNGSMEERSTEDAVLLDRNNEDESSLDSTNSVFSARFRIAMR